jgi:sugar phosphate isomerase/epimerase
MKLATTLGDFGRYPMSPKERLRLIYDAGFRYIDLPLGGKLFSEDDSWREIAKGLVDAAGELGMRFVQSHSPNTASLTPDRWGKEVFWAKRSLEICAVMGIPQSVIHGGYTRTPVCKESWYEQNSKFYREILPVAEETGVMILTENTTHANLKEGRYYLYTGEDMVEYIEYIDHPLFQAVWDTGHGTTEGSQYDNIVALGKHLKGLHVHDNNGKADEHIMPYTGVLNLDQVMNGLLDVGYDGYFTFEVLNALRRAKDGRQPRQVFERDTRLADPTLEMRIDMERLLYHIGRHALTAYNCFEE